MQNLMQVKNLFHHFLSFLFPIASFFIIVLFQLVINVEFIILIVKANY